MNQLHVINSLNPKIFDICFIQEPYLDFLNNTRAPTGWTTIYPPTHFKAESERTRSIILVSPHLATSNWMDLRIDSPDVTGIQIWGEFGTIRFFNIYNDCDHSASIDTLKKWYRNAAAASSPPTPAQTPRAPAHALWLGDFNRHDPLWEEERNKHLFTREAERKTRPLLSMLAAYDMEMVLPKNIPTLEASSTKNWTCPDNVFGSGAIHQRIIKCDVDPSRRPPLADHLPIVTEIDVLAVTNNEKPRRDWRDVDWTEFTGELIQQLTTIGEPKEIHSWEQLKKAIEDLEMCIGKTVSSTVPMKKPTPFRKRWWTKELTEARKALKRASHRSHRKRLQPDDPVHEDFKKKNKK
jgi:hypothetical protein